jgi:hypothetical protein
MLSRRQQKLFQSFVIISKHGQRLKDLSADQITYLVKIQHHRRRNLERGSAILFREVYKILRRSWIYLRL